MTNNLLANEDIRTLICFLQRQPQHSNFTISKMEMGDKTISHYQSWLMDEGFVSVVNFNYFDASTYLMIFTERGRRLVKSKNYKWLLLKEWIDSAMKYGSFVLAVIAIILSIIALVHTPK